MERFHILKRNHQSTEKSRTLFHADNRGNQFYFNDTVEFTESNQPIKGFVPLDGVLVNFKLPESRGTNEVSGKEFMPGINSRWTFSDDTYVYEYLWGEETILEDCVIFNSYRLIRLGRENNEGIE